MAEQLVQIKANCRDTIPQDEGTRNDLPLLYARELGPNNYLESVTKKDSQINAKQHQSQEEADSGENQDYTESYRAWKDENQIFIGRSELNMTSSLGKQLIQRNGPIHDKYKHFERDPNSEMVNQFSDQDPFPSSHDLSGQLRECPLPATNSPHVNFHCSQFHNHLPNYENIEANHNFNHSPNNRAYTPHLPKVPTPYSRASCGDNASVFPRVSPCCRPSQSGSNNGYFSQARTPHNEFWHNYSFSPADKCFRQRHPVENHFNKCDRNVFPPTEAGHYKLSSKFHKNCACNDPSFRVQGCHSNKECKEAKVMVKKTKISLRNLYRIVWLQNQQLGLLQKQIDKLLENDKKKSVKPKERTNNRDMCEIKATSTLIKKGSEITVERTSVGVMTSLINCDIKCNTPPDISKGCEGNASAIQSCDSSENESESEIEEINATLNKQWSNNRLPKEESLTLHGIDIPIPEELPSPPTSIHVDIQEYQSDTSESSEDATSSEEGNASGPTPVGWTFYDSVVGQVNDILTNSEENTSTNDNIESIRNTTLDQLRQLGVSLADGDMQAQKRVTFDSPYCPRTTAKPQKALQSDSDTSMHINALALKYLQGEHCAPAGSDKIQGKKYSNTNNLSFATLQYLERYQLMPSSKKKEINRREEVPVAETKQTGKKKAHNKHSKKKSKPISKILDVTTIKQQPKLLPKNISK